MSTNGILASSIENTSLQGNSIARKGDGTFEQNLASAQIALELKTIKRLFNFKELEFNFNLQTSKPDITQNNEETAPQNVNLESKPEQIQETTNQNLIEYKNTEVLKEILAKNLPNPTLQPFAFSLMPFAFNNQSVTQSNLKLLIDEIVKQAKLVKSGEKTELSLTLAPKDLGELLLSISIKNGYLSVQINANPETKKLLEQNLDELKLAFSESNIELEEILITEVKSAKYSHTAG